MCPPVPPASRPYPVLVGVGAVSAAAPVVDLMEAAARAAAADAGSDRLLASVTRIAVPQGSWSLLDPGRSVAMRIGATDARSVRYEIGVSQQEMINHALEAVADGSERVILVVGAEDRAFARAGGDEVDDASGPPDDTVTRPPDFVAPIEVEAGIVWPVVQQYAMIENALAVAEQLTPEGQRAEIADLWTRFNAVAHNNPHAAFPASRSANDIATPGPKNRPLADPYNHWHSSQWNVDQAAALLVCTTETAADLRVSTDRWVFPHVALSSSSAVTLAARRHLHRWPAMATLGRAAASHLGYPIHDVTLAEVYSCFPAAVRVQQRELGLDLDGTPTLTGGMAFAGGPFNHFVLQALPQLVAQLRQAPDRPGLITTVSGMLSKPGLAVWACSPPPKPPLVADLGAEGAAATDIQPVVDAHEAKGPGTVVSATVTFGADDPLSPVRTAVVVDLPDGRRSSASLEDAGVAKNALGQGLIGREVHVEGATFAP